MARNDPYSGPLAGPAFEAHVLRRFKDELFAYCARAMADPRVDPARLRVRITVVTAAPLERIRDDLREVAQRAIARDLPGAALGGLALARDTTGLPPGYRVVLAPALDDVGDVTTAPIGSDDTYLSWHRSWHRGDADASLVLTLSYGEDLSWEYELRPTAAWIPLGRGLPDDPHAAAVRLPDHMVPVPRGPLVEIRYWRGDAHLRRTRHRAIYTVCVDGRRLPPGATVGASWAGSVDYVRGDGPYTVLTYQLSGSGKRGRDG